MSRKKARRREQNKKPGARNRAWMEFDQAIRHGNAAVPIASATTYNRAKANRDWKRES